MSKKRRFTIIMLLTGFVVISYLATSCTSPSLPPVAQPPPKKSTTLTYALSDITASQLMTKLVGICNVSFLPGNKAHIRYGGIYYDVSIEAIEGELCLSGIEGVIYRYGPGRGKNAWGWIIDKYLKKYENDGKVHLIALWFDPVTVLKAESDKLPFIESVTTTEYEAIFTYRQP